MGLCHISGIRLNIPQRCSTPDELPFNYNLLLVHALIYSAVIKVQYLGIIPVGRLHLHTWTETILSGVERQAQIVGIPCQRAHVLQPNDSDLTGFQKPTSIFVQRFLCCAQTICSHRQSNVQIKACYPLLRGRLHIMMEGLDFISVCERITHCCGGRKFISPLF